MLYTASALVPDRLVAAPGVDLFLLGPAPATINDSVVTPKPQDVSIFPDPMTGKSSLMIDSTTFDLTAPPGAGPVLTAGIRRYLGSNSSLPGLLFIGNERRTDRGPSMAVACTKLKVIVHELSEDGPHLGDDESYILTLTSSNASLESNTVWGALRGLETFGQLLSAGADFPGFYFANVQQIIDAPQYMYRGLLVDTARHFLPVNVLLAVLDGMAIEKFNVLHWHSVDDQAFPMPSPTLPALETFGPYSPGLSYSQADVTRVVNYAKYRGIRVVVEMDTPGHSKVIGEAFPGKDYLTDCLGITGWLPLDVTKKATLDLVATIWKDLVALFPDNYVFLGGDECHTECWAANPAINEWTQTRNLTANGSGSGSLFQWYIKEVVSMVAAYGKSPMMWSPLEWDTWAPPFNGDAIMNIWTGNVAELVYNISITNKLVTSFNWYLPAGAAYRSDPQGLCSGVNGAYKCNDTQLANIIGGEACLWGEGVDRGNFFTSAWPDLTAVAERLWSPKNPQGGLDLQDGDQRRLRLHRCRLASRGLPLAPMSSVYMPDASHASFARWRQYQWCEGDQHFGYVPDSQ